MNSRKGQRPGPAGPPSFRYLRIVALLGLASGAASGGGGCPGSLPPLIRDLSVSPNPAVVGAPARVSFTISHPAREVVTWTAALAENPQAGGSLPSEGQTDGRSADQPVVIVYTPRGPTSATITINAVGSKGKKALTQSVVVSVR